MAGEERDAAASIPDALSLFASRLSNHRFGDEELRVLEAALSAGGDVAALLETRSSARRLLRERAAEALAAAAEEDGTRLGTADLFARAFALVGDVESCLAMRYEALVLREAKYSNDLHLRVSHEEWLTFAKDSLHNGFYTIASKAFANALVHIHPSHPGYLDSTNSILKMDGINDIRGLQNLAKSLSALRSVQTQSAEYMTRKASGVTEKCNLHSGKPKLPGSSMFRLGIKARNIQKLLRSRERNLEEGLVHSGGAVIAGCGTVQAATIAESGPAASQLQVLNPDRLIFQPLSNCKCLHGNKLVVVLREENVCCMFQCLRKRLSNEVISKPCDRF